MGLKDVIREDVTRVFCHADDTGALDEHAEFVTLYPAYERERRISIPAIAIPDRLEGTREAYGDGVVLDTTSNGLAERNSLFFEFPRLVILKANHPQVGFTAFTPTTGSAGDSGTASRGTETATGIIRDLEDILQRPSWDSANAAQMPDGIKHEGKMYVIVRVTGTDANMISVLAVAREDSTQQIPRGQ